MQREIKFRGKRVDNGEWVYGDLLNCYTGEKRIIFLEMLGNIDDIQEVEHNYEVIPETVGQFTGLKDKNGVEIYEDSILIGISNNPFSNGEKREYEVNGWHVKETFLSLQELFYYCGNDVYLKN